MFNLFKRKKKKSDDTSDTTATGQQADDLKILLRAEQQKKEDRQPDPNVATSSPKQHYSSSRTFGNIPNPFRDEEAPQVVAFTKDKPPSNSS